MKTSNASEAPLLVDCSQKKRKEDLAEQGDSLDGWLCHGMGWPQNDVLAEEREPVVRA
jgi:hypothetical protein